MRLSLLVCVAAVGLSGVVGCGSDQQGDAELNAEDDAAIAEAFSRLQREAKSLERKREAEAAGQESAEQFSEATGVAIPEEDTTELEASIEQSVNTIDGALEDESPTTMVPSQDGQTVEAFLGEVASVVQGANAALADQLDRVRETLDPDASGGPSTPEEAVQSDPASVAVELQARLQESGFQVREDPSTGGDAGLVVDPEYYVEVYPSEDEASTAYSDLKSDQARIEKEVGVSGIAEQEGSVVVWYSRKGEIPGAELSEFEEIVSVVAE